MPRTIKKYWEQGLSSSELHEQNMINKYKSDYTKNKITKATLVDDVRIVPSIIPLANRNRLSHNPSTNSWRSSTYHLNHHHHSGMLKLQPVYTHRTRNGVQVKN
jgi:hypothetical protein